MSIDSTISIVSIPDGKLFADVISFETKFDNENDKSSRFTHFTLEIQLGNQLWTVNRRYNEFEKLNNEVKNIDCVNLECFFNFFNSLLFRLKNLFLNLK
jgi:hypothetical protein